LIANPSIKFFPYVELAEGVWFPKGGVFEIALAFERLFSELGGKIHYNQPIEALCTEGKKVIGIVVNGKRKEFDAVVCNQDTGAALMDLIPEKLRPSAPTKKIEALNYGCSSFMIYLGVNRKYNQIGHHTVILPEHFDEMLKELFKKGIPPKEPAYYLCRPTATDPTLAPKGCDVIYLLVPVPNLQHYDKWDRSEVEKYKNTMLNQLEKSHFPELKKHIVLEKIFTPRDFKSVYQILHGSAFGLSPLFFQSAYFRPRNVSPDLKNLFFVGASAHPGGGVPVVLLSGRLVANEIAKRYPKPEIKKRVTQMIPQSSELETSLITTE